MLFVIFPLLLLTFYLCLFISLITVCLGVFLLWFILPGTLCSFWIWLTISFPVLGKFSASISPNIFLGPFSLSLWHPYNVDNATFSVVPEVSQAVFIFYFSLFFLYCFAAVISSIMSSRSLLCSYALIILLVIPSSVLFTSRCWLFSSPVKFLAYSPFFFQNPISSSLSLF